MALFDELCPTAPGVERRKMFGYPAAFTNGNMFAGLHANSLVLRLPEEPLREFMAAGGAPFEPMPGRPMKGYAVAPDSLLRDRRALASWLERSFEEIAKLPPKEKKAKSRSSGAPLTQMT